MPDENNIIVSYKHKDASDAFEGVQNVAIASMVTSYARVKLYEIIDIVETEKPGSVYYFDTDSLIYETSIGDDVLKAYLKPYLGDLTSEVPPGFTIRAAAFNGPKCYSYMMENDKGIQKSVVKVKGLSLTAEAQRKVNLHSMAELAKEFEDTTVFQKSCIPVDQFRIDTDRETFQIYSRNCIKKHRVTSDKRRILPLENYTLPFGFK